MVSTGMVKVRRRFGLTGWLFALPFTALFVLCFIIPLAVSLWGSLFKRQATLGGLGPVKQIFAGLANYQTVLTSPDLWSGLGHVFAYGIIKIPLVQLTALLLALLLDSLAAKGVGLFRLIYFLPYAIPGVVGAILWSYLYSPNLTPFAPILRFFGLSNEAFLGSEVRLFSMSNMTAWSFIGYNVIIFMATLKSVPHELYEAARIDGASELRIVASIKLPMLKKATLMTVLMSIVGTIQWFNEPTVLRTMVPTIDSNYTPMMMAYTQAFGANNTGVASAISLVMVVVAGILAAIYAFAQSRVGKE